MNNEFLKTEEENFFEDLISFIETEEQKEIDLGRTDSSSHFLIYNERSADFYFGKIKELTEQIEQINKTADEEISRLLDKVEKWRGSKVKPLQSYLDYIKTGLEDYLRREYEASGQKTKKIKLFNGEIKFAKQQAEYKYDEESIMSYLLNNETLSQRFLDYKPQLRKKDLKAAGDVIGTSLFIDGQEVPGIQIISHDDKVVIKTI